MLTGIGITLGFIYGKLGRYEEAIKSYDEAIRIMPDDTDAWNNKIIALGKLGRYEEAIKSYDEANHFTDLSEFTPSANFE